MKKLAAVVLSLSMFLFIAGCGMFADSDSGDGGDSGFEAIKITDTFSSTDPDVEFDERQVLYGDRNSSYAQVLSDQDDMRPSDIYMLIYGNGGTPVYSIEYMVYDSAEAAEAYQASMKDGGYDVEVDGCVTIFVKDSDAMEAEVIMFQSMSVLADGTMEEYVPMLAGMWGLTEKE